MPTTGELSASGPGQRAQRTDAQECFVHGAAEQVIGAQQHRCEVDISPSPRLQAYREIADRENGKPTDCEPVRKPESLLAVDAEGGDAQRRVCDRVRATPSAMPLASFASEHDRHESEHRSGTRESVYPADEGKI
jgi:hypothetical protein